jgi:hypothetical protein
MAAKSGPVGLGRSVAMREGRGCMLRLDHDPRVDREPAGPRPDPGRQRPERGGASPGKIKDGDGAHRGVHAVAEDKSKGWYGGNSLHE